MYFLIAIILFSFNICLSDEPQNTSPLTTKASNANQSQLPIPALPENGLKNPIPDLGTCNEYSDYYIHECHPFKCSMPLANHPGVTREMSTSGFEKNKCIHQIILKVRHENFRQADIKINCKLSTEGRAEMANLFTRYKKGDITAYTNRSFTSILGKECQ